MLSNDRRAQMFLMAVLIISLWSILMITAINELGDESITEEAEKDVHYLLSEIGREINYRFEYYLNQYSNDQMNYTEILEDFDNYIIIVEDYALANYGATVQIISTSVLTINEQNSLDSGIGDGDFLFLNITSSFTIFLYGITTEVQTELGVGISVYADIEIDSSSTRLKIFKENFVVQPVIYANISFTNQTASQFFESYLNGTYYIQEELTAASLNITTSDGIILRSKY